LKQKNHRARKFRLVFQQQQFIKICKSSQIFNDKTFLLKNIFVSRNSNFSNFLKRGLKRKFFENLNFKGKNVD